MAQQWADRPSQPNDEYVLNADGQRVKNRAYRPTSKNARNSRDTTSASSVMGQYDTGNQSVADRILDIIDDDTVHISEGGNNSLMVTGEDTGLKMEVVRMTDGPGYVAGITDKKNRPVIGNDGMGIGEVGMSVDEVGQMWKDNAYTIPGNGYDTDDVYDQYEDQLLEALLDEGGGGYMEQYDSEVDLEIKDSIQSALDAGDITDELTPEDIKHVASNTMWGFERRNM